MRRTICLLAVVLLVVPSLGLDAPREYDGAAEPIDDIRGAWELTAQEIGGEMAVPVGRYVVTYRAGAFFKNYANHATSQGSYRLDRAGKPARLDWCLSDEESRGLIVKFIYEVKEDTLRVAYLARKSRYRHPEGFNEEGVIVEHYKRVK